MYSFIKVVSILSCGVLLCLGLSQAAFAAQGDEGASRLTQAKVIKGVLVRIDYGDYLIKEKLGAVARLSARSKIAEEERRKSSNARGAGSIGTGCETGQSK